MLSTNRGIATRLKQVRERFEYTQKYISEVTGCTLNSWQKYEKAKSIPGGKVLAGLSRLGVNVDWVLTGEGEMMAVSPEKPVLDIPGIPYTDEQAEADMYDDVIHNDPGAIARRASQKKACDARREAINTIINEACNAADYAPPKITRCAINAIVTTYNINPDDLMMLIVSLKHDQDN